MNRLLWLWDTLLEVFTRLGWRRPIYRGVRVADLPDTMRRERVYIAGEDGCDWTAAMLCPGGCGKVLEMNLLPDAHPVWRVVEPVDRAITLHPSVWLKSGCGCHFTVRDGVIDWV